MPADRSDIGFLLALTSRRWNETLERRFAEAGFGEVRASYGAVLIPLFEEDGLRMSALGQRASLSKQTMTTMVRLLERDGLVVRRADPDDARASRVYLTRRAKVFRSSAEKVLRELDAEVVLTLGTSHAAALKHSLATLLDLHGRAREPHL